MFPSPSTSVLTEGMRRTLDLLLQARELAEDLGTPVRHFAVEREELLRHGATSAEIRWLWLRSCIQIESGEGTVRQPRPPYDLPPQGRFVLSPSGLALVRTARSMEEPQDRSPPLHDSRHRRPHYDAGTRTLRYGGEVVKVLRQRAENQELILSAFEEEGWPECMDDPLRPVPGIDSQRRLHDTLSRLNRQRKPLLRFGTNGTGRAVVWAEAGKGRESAGSRKPKGD